MNRESRHVWEVWREQLWSQFVRLDSSSSDEGFFGDVQAPVARSNRLSIVHSTKQVTERTTANLRSDPQDFVLLALQVNGYGFIEQNGRQARLEAGDFGCYMTDQPYRLAFDSPFRQIILRLPRERLASHLPCVSHVTARRFDGMSGAGMLATAFIRQIVENGGSLVDDDLRDFEGVTAQMVATAIQQNMTGTLDGDAQRLERVKRALTAGLRNPDLDLAQIAAEESISLRTLQRLFQGEGLTPSQWVLKNRLKNVADDLRDPVNKHRSITDIALSWGFGDISHFSRAFRQYHGTSARIWRSGS